MIKKKQSLGAKILSLFGIGKMDEKFFDELGDMLIEGDLGARVAMDVVDKLQEQVKKARLKTKEDFLKELEKILSEYLLIEELKLDEEKTNFFLVLGVNGVGKTTTIAKLAHYFKKQIGGDKIILSAGDTFRAAAIEQLKLHGERLDIKVVHQQTGSDPGAVIYDSIVSANTRGAKLILADTAGRLHNKAHLIKELEKVDKIVKNRLSGGVYKKILILDATTGQNAIQQVEIFHNAVKIDSLILAKYDSTAKGGMVIPICKNLGIPFSFMGTGEKLEDLVPFNKEKYFESLFGEMNT